MKRLAMVLPLLVAVAACGDNNKAADATTTSPPSPTTTAAPSTTIATTTSPTTTAEATTTTQAAEPGSLESPIPLGEAADIGQGWTLKIVSYNPSANEIVADASPYNKYVQLPEGTVYIVFNVEMTYSGDGDHNQSPPYLLLQSVGPTQKKYDGTSVMNALPPQPAFDNVGEVPIGGTAAGNIVQFVDIADAVGLIAFTEDILGGGRLIYFATS